jgi:nucleoside-diphosphate-sugar epimerase
VNWSNKKVLVTGAGGFIGSHLVERLIELGADVTAFVRYKSRNGNGFLPRHGVRLLAGDVRDADAVAQAIASREIVFHLAALPGIPYSNVHPGEVFDVNAGGTVNILNAARRAGLEKIVLASSSEVYGPVQYVPIDERHPLRALSPYAASKIAAESMGLSYHASFGLPVAVARLFNTYGPRQSSRAVIPTIICQGLAGGVIRIGNLTPTRDLCFVADTVAGLIAIAASARTCGETVNLGTGSEISIGDLARKIAVLLGGECRLELDPLRARLKTSEVERLLASNAKASEIAGWAPAIGLDEGLVQTVDWIRNHGELYDPLKYEI